MKMTVSRAALAVLILCATSIAWSQSAPVVTSVVSGFGGLPFVSPNGFARLTGTGLADAAGFNFGTTKIFVNGVQALGQAIGVDSTNTIYTLSFQIPPQTSVGPGSFVVSHAGVSSAQFSFPISQYSPQLSGVGATPLATLQHADGTTLDGNSPAVPGEKVKCAVSGLGAGNPPTVPQLNVVGFSTAVEAIKENDPIFNFPGVYGLTFVVPPTLGSGSFPISISINNVSSTTRFLPVQSTGLNLSQTGVTFRAVAGSPNALQRTITVSSTSQIINWTATTATISGGTWLQVSPAAGSSDPSKPAPTIQITASAAQLQAGNVYGTVTIRSNLAQQVITVVLSVLPPTQSPGAVVEPTGIVFIGAPGAAPPAAKTTQISNPTTAALTFTTKSAFSTAASWFTFQPAIGSVAPGTPVTITVQPVTGLAAGTYSGSITFTFSDATQRVVNLLLVLSAGASGGSSASLGIAAATCAPSKLLPVFTLLGLNFTSPVAWPTNIDAFVVDDCGTAVTTGAVSASFSNGDSPLGLVSLQNGHFAATWTPRNPVNANLVVTVKASVFSPNLSGTASLSGSAPANPNIPIVFSGGVVGTASYVASPAPGTLISLFGAELADNLLSATQLPLPNQLLTTQVVLGGVNLPLVFVSAGQINALVPYGLKPKTSYQVIVQRGTVISTPETVAVLDSQPAVFTTDQSGKGQGHIYHITADGLQILAGVGQAVTAGDVLTVYCSGLGEVTPPTVAGSPAPLDTLENTTNPVTATIGGVSAKMLFAGLTPGFTGLYQVNLIVPGGVAAGDSVPVVLSSAGQVSQPVTIAVR